MAWVWLTLWDVSCLWLGAYLVVHNHTGAGIFLFILAACTGLRTTKEEKAKDDN